MSNYNYVNRVLIGDGVNSAAITSLPSIQKGDLFLVRESGTIVNSVAAANAIPRQEKVYIAMGVGPGIAVLSSPIQGNTVSKFEGVTAVTPLEQVAYVGFNGTTGALTAVANAEYRLRILIKDKNRINGERSTLMDYNAVIDGGGGQQEAAQKIAVLYDQKDYGVNYMGDKVLLERVSNGTFTAFGANATVVNGAKLVTSTAHGRAVGDIVRIGGTGATVGVYIVASVIDANNFTLDSPYKGTSGTVLAANIGTMTVVTSWGFKLTSLAQTSRLTLAGGAPFDEYEWIIFDASYALAAESTTNNTAAPYTLSQIANPGQGFWKQVADREEFAKGYLGDTSKRRSWDQRITSQVVQGQMYDTVEITHQEIMKGDFQGDYASPLLTEIYIPNGSTQADPTPANNNFKAILNGYFGTVLGFTFLT